VLSTEYSEFDMTAILPDTLCHYYEAENGPFRNLSSMPMETASEVLDSIRQNAKAFASRRSIDYLSVRRTLEARVRGLFIAKGGQPQTTYPHYLVLGHVPWLLEWFEHARQLCIPLSTFDENIVSFTYGDTFPAMRIMDGKPYRRQVYTLSELPALVTAYGLPQECNADGHLGPERYIEAQVWSDQPLLPYLVEVMPVA
jgi:hypothetical protein